MKQHICVDVRLIQATGIGTFIRNILNEFASREEFHLTLLHKAEDREFLLKYAPHNLIALEHPIYSWKEQIELPLKIPSCDLFWSPHFNIPLFPIKAKKRLVTIHDVYHLAHLSQFSPLQKIYAKVFYRAACALSDHVTTVSHFSKQEILKYCCIHPKKLTAIPFAVSPHFRPHKNEEVRKKYGLPENFVVTVTNFKPHKNLQRLILACKDLKLNLVIVGKYKEPFELKQYVTLAGYVAEEDLPAIYTMAEAFAFPSLYEGFGSPPLEAMACGCPVIVSNKASLPEICQEAAEYVDPLDIGSIRTGIKKALERREDLIERGFKHIQKWHIRDVANHYIELIRNL